MLACFLGCVRVNRQANNTVSSVGWAQKRRSREQQFSIDDKRQLTYRSQISNGNSASNAGSTQTLRFWFQADPIIHRVAEALFATQVPLRWLHRDMPQKELNLLQLPASLMPQTRACALEVVKRERRNLTVLCLLLHDTPNDLWAKSGAPNPSSLVDRTKERASCMLPTLAPSSATYPARYVSLFLA
jgi:hypothetical protein